MSLEIMNIMPTTENCSETGVENDPETIFLKLREAIKSLKEKQNSKFAQSLLEEIEEIVSEYTLNRANQDAKTINKMRSLLARYEISYEDL